MTVLSMKKFFFRSFSLVFIVFTVQSCFVSKNYERPSLKEINNLYRTDQLPADSISMASLSWKQLFTDPYLSGYIEEGLLNNLDVRIALQQIVAADALVKQGKAGYLPSLTTRGTLTHLELARNSQFGSFFSGALDQYEFSGVLSWEADIWGKIRSSKRAAQANYLQQVASHQAIKTQLISQITVSYYQLLALDEQAKITKETIENRTKSLETIRALKEAGNVNQVAVDQTAAQLYNAQALLIDIEKNIFWSENLLSILLGKPSQVIERGKLEEQQLNPELSLGFSALLLRNRPDVVAAEYNLVNAFELTNVAESNFYPSFTFSATSGFQSIVFDQWFSSGSIFSTLVGGIAQPIFNRRQIRTQYEQTKAQQQQSLLNFEKTLLIAGQEVSDALFEFNAESRKSEFRQKEVEALRKAEANSEVLLNNGFGTYLDLLTARQNALNAELNVVDNKLQQLQSIVSLYRALGGGWQ